MSKAFSSPTTEQDSERLAAELAEVSQSQERATQVRAAALEKWSVLALIIENEVEEANEKLKAAGVRARFIVDLQLFEEGEGDIAKGHIVLLSKEAPLIEVRFTASRYRTLFLDISEVTSAEPFELAFDECTRSLWREITIRMMRRAVLN